MKTPRPSIILPLVLWSASLAMGNETPTELEKRAAEQERQIRQLEVQNQRLRDQIERLQERLAAVEDAPAAPRPPATDAPPPPPAPPAEPELAPSEPPTAATHVVKAGESLSKIAHQHGTTTAALAALNGIKNPSLIREGQKLRLPAADAPTEEQSEALSGTHTVKSGETFYSIAKIYGLSPDALQVANPGVDPKALKIGQELKLLARKREQPASSPDEPESSAPGRSDESEPPPLSKRPVIRSVPIDENISFGEFARRHRMDPGKLNALNGLHLESNTVLATGSRLYVSAQPLE